MDVLSVCVCVGQASLTIGWPIIFMQGNAIILTAQPEKFTQNIVSALSLKYGSACQPAQHF